MDASQEAQQAVAMMEEMRAARGEEMRKAAMDLGQYEGVRQLVAMPGWEIFIANLARRADEERKACDEILTALLATDSPSLRQQFFDAKMRWMGLEVALNLYRWMRDSASSAKILLDSTPPAG